VNPPIKAMNNSNSLEFVEKLNCEIINSFFVFIYLEGGSIFVLNIKFLGGSFQKPMQINVLNVCKNSRLPGFFLKIHSHFWQSYFSGIFILQKLLFICRVVYISHFRFLNSFKFF